MFIWPHCTCAVYSVSIEHKLHFSERYQELYCGKSNSIFHLEIHHNSEAFAFGMNDVFKCRGTGLGYVGCWHLFGLCVCLHALVRKGGCVRTGNLSWRLMLAVPEVRAVYKALMWPAAHYPAFLMWGGPNATVPERKHPRFTQGFTVKGPSH